MEDKVRQILAKISALEDELQAALHEREVKFFYRLEGRRVMFEQTVRHAHRRVKRGILRWIVTDRPQNFLTGPIIYGMGIPLVIIDLAVTFYQATCFPVYRIAKVRRSDYIVIDRHHLDYLNWFEKFHCVYCAYANGLIAYLREIIARTEQYFCPIKHAHKILGAHSRYKNFLGYGDAQDYHARLEAFRTELASEENPAAGRHGGPS